MSLESVLAVEKIFLDTNFANLFAFPGFFKLKAGLFELKTDYFVRWFDRLGLPLVDNLWINSYNSCTDKEEIYSYSDFKKYGYGELISRSIAIPAFIDKGYYMDGGLGQNGPLNQWSEEKLPIFLSQLMHPYRTTPKSRIEKLLYMWDVTAFQKFQYQKLNFPNIKVVYPDTGEISSLDFGLSKNQKIEMIEMAYKITVAQLEFLQIKKQDKPVQICLALSGGGARSFSHIGVVKALLEWNYIPVKWSGTSGGSIVACALAGMEKKLRHV